ncbi:MAG: 1-acyl-sn-glycerol-3-phosphate acyltransferase [Candidatus Tokpelaia sp. JSC161]|jgi:1-acyl-sn-glycerol-3-phosphate acyltransferase|nr:MAG: 1-acyl-sn-glycerol-3-phosphate acyltransferase [Candidatus Tokpelaia sp. JSC161]
MNNKKTTVLILKSIIFKICFISVTIIEMILFTPFYFFLSHKKAWIVPRLWIRTILFLQKYIVGISYQIEGIEHLPHNAYIIAAKHQSIWETLILVLHIQDPTFILKRELMRIPVFGCFLAKMNMIPINRRMPLKALRMIIKQAKQMVKANRQIIIFPEGTRQFPGEKPKYKNGIFQIYSELVLPVIPIALNSGIYWPKKQFCLYPGIIQCRILPPIQPGLKKIEFMTLLEKEIENSCDELLLIAAQDNPLFFTQKTAVKRLKQLTNNGKIF